MSGNDVTIEDVVKSRINERFEQLFANRQDGTPSAYVCVVCDRLLKPKEVCRLDVDCLRRNAEVLSPSVWNAVDPALARCYKFPFRSEEESDNDATENMLLSPRASFVQDRMGRTDFTRVSSCSSCKRSVQQGRMPRYAIANNYCFGTPPQCLLELTDIELALLTPVKAYGYCFCYTGGVQ